MKRWLQHRSLWRNVVSQFPSYYRSCLQAGPLLLPSRLKHDDRSLRCVPCELRVSRTHPPADVRRIGSFPCLTQTAVKITVRTGASPTNCRPRARHRPVPSASPAAPRADHRLPTEPPRCRPGRGIERLDGAAPLQSRLASLKTLLTNYSPYITSTGLNPCGTTF